MDILKDRRYISIEDDFEERLKELNEKIVILKRNKDIKIKNLLKQYKFVPRFSQIKVDGELGTYIGIDDSRIICADMNNEEEIFSCDISNAELITYNDEIRVGYIVNGVSPKKHHEKGLIYPCIQIDILLGLEPYTISHWLVSNGYVSKIGTRVNKKGKEYLYYLDCGDWRMSEYELCATIKGLKLIVDDLDEIKELK